MGCMRVLLAGTGTRGDVQPLLALALALRARGDEVVLRVPPDFQDWIRGHGLPCEPMGPPFRTWLGALQEDAQRHPYRTFRAGMRALWQDEIRLASEVAPTDLVVGTGTFPAGPSIAEVWGVPSVTVLLQPTMMPDASYPPIFFRRQGGPRWLNSALWRLWGPMLNLACRDLVNEGRRELGLSPVTDMSAHIAQGSRILLAVDPAFMQPLPRWGFAHAFTGFWFLVEAGPLDDEIEAFLRDGSPPIYVGFGSMTSSRADQLSALVAEAATQVGVRAVISSGWAGLGRRNLGSNCLTVGPVPHGVLFPRMRGVVHHGGAGTTAAAARAGVPQVVVPHLLDQFYWAARVEKLGIGTSGPSIDRLGVRGLVQAIHSALDPEVQRRARELGHVLRSGDGLGEALKAIDGWTGRAHRPYA